MMCWSRSSRKKIENIHHLHPSRRKVVSHQTREKVIVVGIVLLLFLLSCGYHQITFLLDAADSWSNQITTIGLVVSQNNHTSCDSCGGEDKERRIDDEKVEEILPNIDLVTSSKINNINISDDNNNNNNNDVEKERVEELPPIIKNNEDNNNNEKSTQSSCHNPAVNMLTVASSSSSPRPNNLQHQKQEPRILCFVLSQKKNHNTRIKAIWDTWGRKCDKLIIASDSWDPSINAYEIKTPKGYWSICFKVEKIIKKLYNHYRHEDRFDWILKADDDTYVIMENLKSFLANATTATTTTTTTGLDTNSKHRNGHHHHHGPHHHHTNHQDNDDTTSTTTTTIPPLLYGRLMPYPELKMFWKWPGWFPQKNNNEFGKRFSKKINMNQTLNYAHGGPGYVMNWQLLDVLVGAYKSNDRMRGKLSEDISMAATLLYHGVRPQSTFDPNTGLERSHPEPPSVMYENPEWLAKEQINIQHLGSGTACCAATSISYHHMSPEDMYSMEHQLYHCPTSS